jgi:hypothetical protein
MKKKPEEHNLIGAYETFLLPTIDLDPNPGQSSTDRGRGENVILTTMKKLGNLSHKAKGCGGEHEGHTNIKKVDSL